MNIIKFVHFSGLKIYIIPTIILLLVFFIINQYFYKNSTQYSVKPTPLPNYNAEILDMKNSLAKLQLNKNNKLVNETPSNFNTETQISELTKQLNELKKTITELINSKNNTSSNNTANDSNTLTYEEINQQQEIQNSELESLYSNTLEFEPQDPQWSLLTEDTTRNSLSNISDKISLTDIECKTSLCKLEFTKIEGTSDDEVMDAFETSVDWDGAMELTYDPKTGEATVYMARNGFDLPLLEN